MNRRSRFTSFQSTYSTPSVMSRLVFFFALRALSLFFERDLAGIRRAPRRGRRAPARWSATGTAAPSAAPAVAAVPAVAAADLGGGPAQAGTDLVGDDLDDRAALAVVGLPRALLEAAGHDDPRPLLQRLGHVLGEVTPAGDVEEGGALLPLLGVAVLPPAVDGHPKVVTGAPAGVKRSSGSRVRLPTMVTLDDMAYGLLVGSLLEEAAPGGLTVGQAHDLVADGLVRESQRPLESGRGRCPPRTRRPRSSPRACG